jgi:predicted alpha/beta-hydrolase family hydrolase
MGRGEPRPTDHLEAIAAPQLFFAGTRDRLSPPPVIGQLVGRLARARLVVIDDGDHSFRVPKRSGRSNEAVLADMAATTHRWVLAEAAGHTEGGGV